MLPSGAAPESGETTARPSAWTESRIVLVLGLALTALVAAAALWVGFLEYRNHVENARSEQALMARVLEDHATLTVDTAAVSLSALADRLASRQLPPGPELTALLREAQAGFPFLRGFALLDANGVVVASTVATDTIGVAVDRTRVGAWPAPGRERLGSFVPGRGIADLAQPAGQPSRAPAGVGFIPMFRTVQIGSDASGLLVAMLNPDAFSNYQTLTLDDARATGLLTSYAGEVLAATVGASVNPGEQLGAHELFRRRLATTEHGTYEGDGIGNSAAQIVAYRVSRQWPLVVLVQHPVATMKAAWWRSMQSTIWVAGTAVLLLGAMTAVACFGLRARERTRKLLNQAQAEVARREQEHSTTLRSVQELIFRTDPQGILTFVNARWTAIAETSPSDAIGMELSALAIPAQRKQMQALFEPASGAGIRNAQITVQAQGGSERRIVDVAVVPLVHRERIIGFAGSAVDVTERVTSQRKLQTQLAITELILQTSPLPLSVRDLRGRYLSTNQAWEQFTGLSRTQVHGHSAIPGPAQEALSFHSQNDDELILRGGRIRYETNMPHADGSRRDVVIEKVLMPGDGGKPAGILSVLMDVSEFRAAERATRAARDVAEEASRAKSEFIANISHELRTPLQSILGFSELGLMRGRDQPKLRPMFEDILSSGKRMLALVNDLLDVAKLESSVGTFTLERTDLRPLIREVVQELAPQIAAKGLQLEDALAATPLVGKVDPLRFQQVIRNVLANAIRFSPAQGIIAISGECPDGQEIVLRIRDQGPGIPDQETERIFAAFVQSTTTKDGSGGTGLGLAICRKILEIHGGRISAQNRQTGGAEFVIVLPAKNFAETIPGLL